MYSQPTAAVAERRPHPIEGIDAIRRQVEDLHEIYKELEVRLSPILNQLTRDEAPADPQRHEAMARSPVMEGLEVVSFNLNSLAEKMQELIRRLDL